MEFFGQECFSNVFSVFIHHADKTTQHQVILQARSAAPMMRMEGVFWQGSGSFYSVRSFSKYNTPTYIYQKQRYKVNSVIANSSLVMTQPRHQTYIQNPDLLLDVGKRKKVCFFPPFDMVRQNGQDQGHASPVINMLYRVILEYSDV